MAFRYKEMMMSLERDRIISNSRLPLDNVYYNPRLKEEFSFP